MSVGYITLGFGGYSKLYFGIVFIVCGYGFFKNNVSCLLGKQYNSDDPNKDSTSHYYT